MRATVARNSLQKREKFPAVREFRQRSAPARRPNAAIVRTPEIIVAHIQLEREILLNLG
jgi:hypothetical protein